MKTHVIESGIIVNTILASVAEAQSAYPQCVCVDASSGGNIGDSWDGASFSSPAPSTEDINGPILAQLAQIDTKSIRALREGDAARISALESQAAALRSQLIK